MLGTVIIIDDDDDTLATLNTLVTMEGLFCETYSSATAYQAALARDERLVMRQEAVLPRCIFCDVNMPGLTGHMRQLKDQCVEIA
jgi:FixJ family two-component response regulator